MLTVASVGSPSGKHRKYRMLQPEKFLWCLLFLRGFDYRVAKTLHARSLRGLRFSVGYGYRLATGPPASLFSLFYCAMGINFLFLQKKRGEKLGESQRAVKGKVWLTSSQTGRKVLLPPAAND